MYITIQCPNIRPKSVEDEYRPGAKCNRVLGHLKGDSEGFIVKCQSCKTWHEFTMTKEELTSRLITADEMTFSNKAKKIKTLSYKMG